MQNWDSNLGSISSEEVLLANILFGMEKCIWDFSKVELTEFGNWVYVEHKEKGPISIVCQGLGPQKTFDWKGRDGSKG